MSSRQDTTELRKTTAALRIERGTPRSELEQKARLLSGILDNLPVAVFCKDVADDFRFILWNKQNAEITGISEEEALGKTDHEVFQKETAEFFRQVDEMVVERGVLLDIPEEKVLSPTMGKRFVHTVKVPVTDEGQGMHLLVGIMEDITETKEARDKLRELDEHLSAKEQQLLRLNESLERKSEELKATQLQLIQAEKMESVGRLAAGVAHEVKNPLALMLMGVEYLQGGIEPEDENVPVILKEMREAIERADAIVRGLVDFSSSRQLDLRPVSMNSLVERTLLLVRHELTRGSISVKKDFGKGLPQVKIDKAKMEQVLVNLFINGIHAMERSASGCLEVRTTTQVLERGDVDYDEGARMVGGLRRGDRVVVLEILDTGGGIPEEKIDKIFDPFFTTKPTGLGTGLGLTVVKKIVDLHGGTLNIRNRQDNGVCVMITLKAADDAE